MLKDHYKKLGVIQEAEDIVIKAAYRALAQRYHPDKWTGDPATATRYMSEINPLTESSQIQIKGSNTTRADHQMNMMNRMEMSLMQSLNLIFRFHLMMTEKRRLRKR